MKIKKKYLYLAVMIIFILITALLYLKYFIDDAAKPRWIVDKDGYLNYPLNREPVRFRTDNYSETQNLFINKIIYQSRLGNIYGLLVLPKNISIKIPAVILLPGAGVAKESELFLAEKIAQLGAAVLTIDQRGVGETDGNFSSLEGDYSNFLAGRESYQHLMVYDALRAYDLLHSAPFIDPNRIIFAGESLGGRIAIITAGIDSNINGVLIISSAGYDYKEQGDANKDAFLKSIDSDHYIGLISPRKLVMMHNAQDKIIPLSLAVRSFLKAQQPKRFVLVNDTSCNHGYCDSMHDGMVQGLNFLLN